MGPPGSRERSCFERARGFEENRGADGAANQRVATLSKRPNRAQQKEDAQLKWDFRKAGEQLRGGLPHVCIFNCSNKPNCY